MIIADDRLLAPRSDLPPFSRDQLQAINWNGVDIRVESQDPHRRADSTQARMSTQLRACRDFDVVLDEDRTREAADLVGLAIRGTELHITLVYCNYSSQSTVRAVIRGNFDVVCPP